MVITALYIIVLVLYHQDPAAPHSICTSKFVLGSKFCCGKLSPLAVQPSAMHNNGCCSLTHTTLMAAMPTLSMKSSCKRRTIIAGHLDPTSSS